MAGLNFEINPRMALTYDSPASAPYVLALTDLYQPLQFLPWDFWLRKYGTYQDLVLKALPGYSKPKPLMSIIVNPITWNNLPPLSSKTSLSMNSPSLLSWSAFVLCWYREWLMHHSCGFKARIWTEASWLCALGKVPQSFLSLHSHICKMESIIVSSSETLSSVTGC